MTKSKNIFVKRKINNQSLTLTLTIVSILVLHSMFVMSKDDKELVSDPNTVTTAQDMLAYVTDTSELILYDPHERTEITLLRNVSNFIIAPDNRIAFTKSDETDNTLYVFDPSTNNVFPIISENPTANHYPLAWSPNGLYLAFGSYDEINDHTLYVWDGEKSNNIMPLNNLDTASNFYVDWSYDGRIAFTIVYGWSNLDVPSEIYIWDGNVTMNLSQNPDGNDGGANWSRNNQLMFRSVHDNESRVYIWDGMSFDDSSPNIEAFIRLAPELNPTYTTWINNELVGFTIDANMTNSGKKEVVIWDLERGAITNSFTVSSENAWSRLAEGGEVILSSHLASGIPSVYLDVEDIEGNILFSTHAGEFSWSADGYLAYCGIDEEGRTRILSIWDGEETWVVDHISYTPIRWNNRRGTFSCNNG